MKQLLEKLSALEFELFRQNGEFNLFALIMREEAQDKWDLVISADWLPNANKASYLFITDRVKNLLTENELLSLSRIVLLDYANPVVTNILNLVHVEHATNILFQNCKINGMTLQDMYVITALRKPRAAIDQ